MERPSVALWDRTFLEKHKQWVEWHIRNSSIDNEKEFVREFLKFTKGRVSPQMIREVWNDVRS